MAQTILVCGGAGYIGEHMCERVAEAGYRVVVFDNLLSGHRDAVQWGDLIVGDLRDPHALESVFDTNRFDGVMHFAGKIVVSESTRDPAIYDEHSVAGTLNLLQTMRKHGAPPLVFSSTAAMYGEPQYTPIDESHPCVPVNPYGWGKWIVERMLADSSAAYRLPSVSLRYFNASGASSSGLIGERHDPETHLIPNVLRACVDSRPVEVFGDDYPTKRWVVRPRLHSRLRFVSRPSRRARIPAGRR